jgi:hypothetical protein
MIVGVLLIFAAFTVPLLAFYSEFKTIRIVAQRPQGQCAHVSWNVWGSMLILALGDYLVDRIVEALDVETVRHMTNAQLKRATLREVSELQDVKHRHQNQDDEIMARHSRILALLSVKTPPNRELIAQNNADEDKEMTLVEVAERDEYEAHYRVDCQLLRDELRHRLNIPQISELDWYYDTPVAGTLYASILVASEDLDTLAYRVPKESFISALRDFFWGAP